MLLLAALLGSILMLVMPPWFPSTVPDLELISRALVVMLVVVACDRRREPSFMGMMEDEEAPELEQALDR